MHACHCMKTGRNTTGQTQITHAASTEPDFPKWGSPASLVDTCSYLERLDVKIAKTPTGVKLANLESVFFLRPWIWSEVGRTEKRGIMFFYAVKTVHALGSKGLLPLAKLWKIKKREEFPFTATEEQQSQKGKILSAPSVSDSLPTWGIPHNTLSFKFVRLTPDSKSEGRFTGSTATPNVKTSVALKESLSRKALLPGNAPTASPDLPASGWKPRQRRQFPHGAPTRPAAHL